jgi:SAM-dependent methyltransferase
VSELTAEYWDGQADAFDREPDHGLRNPGTRDAWRRLLLQHLPAPPADIVDLGCGTGTVAVLLAEAGYRVRGLDYSARMVAAATRKAAGARLAVPFVQGDAAQPPFGPGSCDVVFTRHLLWAMPDPAEALRRWCDLLRPGGRLVLVEGRWSTGAGLSGADCERLLRAHSTSVHVHRLYDEVYWGGPISDERYLATSAPDPPDPLE